MREVEQALEIFSILDRCSSHAWLRHTLNPARVRLLSLLDVYHELLSAEAEVRAEGRTPEMDLRPYREELRKLALSIIAAVPENFLLRLNQILDSQNQIRGFLRFDVAYKSGRRNLILQSA